MPDGKRHCAIVLTTDSQLSGCHTEIRSAIAQRSVYLLTFTHFDHLITCLCVSLSVRKVFRTQPLRAMALGGCSRDCIERGC